MAARDQKLRTCRPLRLLLLQALQGSNRFRRRQRIPLVHDFQPSRVLELHAAHAAPHASGRVSPESLQELQDNLSTQARACKPRAHFTSRTRHARDCQGWPPARDCECKTVVMLPPITAYSRRERDRPDSLVWP